MMQFPGVGFDVFGMHGRSKTTNLDLFALLYNNYYGGLDSPFRASSGQGTNTHRVHDFLYSSSKQNQTAP
jgi:hypothetical protein